MFRSAVEKGGVKYKVDCLDDMPKVWVDRDMWEKIVFNLIGCVILADGNLKIR